MLLSVLTPALDGEMPKGVPDDPRIEVILVKGISPVGKARNECLAKAHGDYVAWVDADDEIEDGWLDAVKEAIADKPGAVVFDPFACTGTFLLAAAKLGRKGIGFEIDHENAAIAEQRGCALSTVLDS